MYSDKIQKEIVEIVERVRGRKEHEYAGATYSDIPDLKRLDELFTDNLDNDEDSLILAVMGYNFLAEEYTSLTRMSVAAIFLEKVLKLKIILIKEFKNQNACKNAETVLTNLLRDRNYFVDDDCKDLLALVKGSGLICDAKIDEIYQKRMKNRRTFNNDPVEMTPEYLAVIDEVEEKIAKNKKLKDVCLEEWDLKQQYLAEKGITWKTPIMLNPGVMFD